MIKLINTRKSLALVESNGKGIRWNRKYFLLSTLLKKIRTTVIFTQSFIVEIMYNTYLRSIKRIPVRSKETILPGATLFVFLHPCFRCDRFLVRFLTSVLVKGGNSRCTLRTKTDFFNAMLLCRIYLIRNVIYTSSMTHLYRQLFA